MATQRWVKNSKGEYVVEERKTYSPSELIGIARIMHEAQAKARATIYTGHPALPMYTKWEHLAQPVIDATVKGLKERIEREGLRGYLERKRPEVGDALTDRIISELRDNGYL